MDKDFQSMNFWSNLVAPLTLKEPGGGICPPQHFLLYLSQLLFFARWNFMTFFLQALHSI